MNTADLNKFVGREWPMITIPKKDRRWDIDKRIEVEIGKFHAKHWGIRSAAKFMADENIPEKVARRILLGISE